jgi:hypothetical protein
MSQNEPAGVHAEVRTRVIQELLFTKSIRNEEAACHCSADICCRWCLLRWFLLLAVGAGLNTLSRPGSVVAMIPEGVGAVLSREGDLLPGWRFLEPGRGSLELEQGSLELRWGSIKLVQRRSYWAPSAATWWERSSIPCRSVVLWEGGTQRSIAPAGVRPWRCGPHSGLQRTSCPQAGRQEWPACWG